MHFQRFWSAHGTHQTLADPLFYRFMLFRGPHSKWAAEVAYALAREEYGSAFIARWTRGIDISLYSNPAGSPSAYKDDLAAILSHATRLESLWVVDAAATVAMVSSLKVSASTSLRVLDIWLGSQYRTILSYIGAFQVLETLSLSFGFETGAEWGPVEDNTLESTPEWRFGRLRDLTLDLETWESSTSIRRLFRFMLRCELPSLQKVTINCNYLEPEDASEVRLFFELHTGLSECTLHTNTSVMDVLAPVLVVDCLSLSVFPTSTSLLQFAARTHRLHLVEFVMEVEQDELWELLEVLVTAPAASLQLKRLQLDLGFAVGGDFTWDSEASGIASKIGKLLVWAIKLRQRGILLLDNKGMTVTHAPDDDGEVSWLLSIHIALYS
jgi:hypothetical protein